MERRTRNSDGTGDCARLAGLDRILSTATDNSDGLGVIILIEYPPGVASKPLCKRAHYHRRLDMRSTGQPSEGVERV
jgi:hypothetical protein